MSSVKSVDVTYKDTFRLNGRTVAITSKFGVTCVLYEPLGLVVEFRLCNPVVAGSISTGGDHDIQF